MTARRFRPPVDRDPQPDRTGAEFHVGVGEETPPPPLVDSGPLHPETFRHLEDPHQIETYLRWAGSLPGDLLNHCHKLPDTMR